MEADKPLLINRADRWKDVLDRLKFGADCGVECKQRKKRDAYVTILGRVMTIGEASDLSGIYNDFFKSYEGREVPVEDIINKLDLRWMKKKAKMLQQGMW